ncbi:hypothetical protein HCH_01896 [Hahella chejuensis KCTC 2396]|uniref:Uncharacterized protein n=1 Tax=Hahella chejuensis (strain KCTC 2396) TaxID=349521 RepID=Q2SKU3_HAHCH|nr:hypothetical protein HCH_01896 [Hahella chejuensis KCTC 2396]
MRNAAGFRKTMVLADIIWLCGGAFKAASTVSRAELPQI